MMGKDGVTMWWRMGRWALSALALLFGLIAGYGPQPAEAQVAFTQITNTTGIGGDYPSINADGTRIAFSSKHNLTGGKAGIFLWNAGSGISQITSSIGIGSDHPSINADGTRITFTSHLNLIGGNTDGNRKIFLWTQGASLTQITNTTGIGGDYPSINANGTRIAFHSDRNLTGGNADGNQEIFLWTQGSGFTQITYSTGDRNLFPSINADGTRITFHSGSNLTGDNPDGNLEIFLWTARSGLSQLTQTIGGANYHPSISADGTRITFYSNGDLTGGNPDGNDEIFLWTQGSGITQITNTTEGSNGPPSISADGTRITFPSSGDLIGGNPDGNWEIFLWIQGTGLTQITNSAGGHNSSPSISADGSRIAFVSNGDLTGDNADHNDEIFLATVGGTPPSPSGLSFGNPTIVPKYQLCDYGSKTCADKWTYHTGIDYSGNGTAVAVARGTVVRIERMSSFDHGMGNNVIVSHVLPDGSTIFSTYSHLASLDPGITENRPVDKGRTLGVIGCSGFGDQYYWCRRGKIRNDHAPHLHFEMKTANGPVSGIPSTVTGNPKGVGKQHSTCKEDAKNAAPNTCWGYVDNTLGPDQYGYVDPNRYLPR